MYSLHIGSGPAIFISASITLIQAEAYKVGFLLATIRKDGHDWGYCERARGWVIWPE